MSKNPVGASIQLFRQIAAPNLLHSAACASRSLVMLVCDRVGALTKMMPFPKSKHILKIDASEILKVDAITPVSTVNAMQFNMLSFDPNLPTAELLKLAADYYQKRVELAPLEKDLLISTLKERGRAELDFGQEIEFENVRLIRRVTGAVGIYFQ